MTTRSLLDLLEQEFPTKRKIVLEGKVELYIWKLELPRLMALIALPRETQEEQIKASIEMIVASVGDENGPGALDNERGRLWLATRPNAVLEIARAVQDFLEIDGPSEDRKKKSDSQDSSNASSHSAETLESDTLDD